MPFLYEVGEKLEEECEEQQAYVHAVDVGIRRDNHVVVAEAVDSVLYVEGGLQQVEFLVFVNHFAGQSE